MLHPFFVDTLLRHSLALKWRVCYFLGFNWIQWNVTILLHHHYIDTEGEMDEYWMYSHQWWATQATCVYIFRLHWCLYLLTFFCKSFYEIFHLKGELNAVLCKGYAIRLCVIWFFAIFSKCSMSIMYTM